MEYRKFDYQTKEDLFKDMEKLPASLPWSDDISVLSAPLSITGGQIRNRLLAQPIEGFDSEENGAPGRKALERYQELARGGWGSIWMESVSVNLEGKSSAKQMWLREETLDDFRRLTDTIHQNSETYLVCQITHSGRYSNPDGQHMAVCAFENPMIPKDPTRIITDEQLDALKKDYVQTAVLAQQAGFDAVDIRACHGYLLNELFAAYTRGGRYGGTYENRTRLVREIAEEVRKKTDLAIGVRLNVTDGLPYPYGWGCRAGEGFIQDMTEPLRLVRDLKDLGVSMINVSAGIGAVTPHFIRPYDGGGKIPDEHPLEGVARQLQNAKAVKEAVPEMIVAASAFTWLRQFAPNIAAGCIQEGWFDLAGFGRQWIADPAYARSVMSGEGASYCAACGGCTALIKTGKEMRCVRRRRAS
ncbi:MAG: NADH:flavin oxidoreductase [Lachnospiraceae bacterium]|nr:NADH:flavin oxidoreductase [Lachnospiraceae bacterium]